MLFHYLEVRAAVLGDVPEDIVVVGEEDEEDPEEETGWSYDKECREGAGGGRHLGE